MDYIDLTQLAFSNLWRTRLRTSLTILGVVIGIGALTSMISFGIGMQKNITDAFTKNDLFTSLNITAKNIDFEDISSGNLDNVKDKLQKPTVNLNDSVVNAIKDIPNVVVVFPEISFPVKLRYKGKEKNFNLSAIPMGMKDFYPFNEISHGTFFSNDSAYELLLRKKCLTDMGFTFEADTVDTSSYLGKNILLNSDSIINSTIEIISKDINFRSILANPFMAMMGRNKLPFTDTILNFKIKGILPKTTEFGYQRFGRNIIVPINTAKSIPNLGFNSVWELLDNQSNKENYSSIYVRVKNVKDMKPVVDSIKNKGLNVFAFSEELKEIKRAFMIMDSLLGAIGLIALVVAALGIINTMLMSILERTREIGIMKSIGGSEGEIKTIFFVEASSIGFIGAIFGLGLGWIVTRIANTILNAQLKPEGLKEVDLFSFPWWLMLGAIVFSILISLASGLYPAIRAARIDPVKALRHD